MASLKLLSLNRSAKHTDVTLHPVVQLFRAFALCYVEERLAMWIFNMSPPSERGEYDSSDKSFEAEQKEEMHGPDPFNVEEAEARGW